MIPWCAVWIRYIFTYIYIKLTEHNRQSPIPSRSPLSLWDAIHWPICMVNSVFSFAQPFILSNCLYCGWIVAVLFWGTSICSFIIWKIQQPCFQLMLNKKPFGVYFHSFSGHFTDGFMIIWSCCATGLHFTVILPNPFISYCEMLFHICYFKRSCPWDMIS